MTAGEPRERRSYSWIVLAVICAFLAVSSLAILIGGPESSDFEETTGVLWAELERRDPAVANYIAHLLGLLGVGAAGFALLGGSMVVTAFRSGQRWAWFILVIMPVVYLGYAVVFLRYGFGSLAIYYGLVAALILLLLGLSARRYRRSE